MYWRTQFVIQFFIYIFILQIISQAQIHIHHLWPKRLPFNIGIVMLNSDVSVMILSLIQHSVQICQTRPHPKHDHQLNVCFSIPICHWYLPYIFINNRHVSNLSAFMSTLLTTASLLAPHCLAHVYITLLLVNTWRVRDIELYTNHVMMCMTSPWIIHYVALLSGYRPEPRDMCDVLTTSSRCLWAGVWCNITIWLCVLLHIHKCQYHKENH